ncbi:MAG: tetratricopeptide repeat protein [Candidatus Obscuribacterales bacterium]
MSFGKLSVSVVLSLALLTSALLTSPGYSAPVTRSGIRASQAKKPVAEAPAPTSFAHKWGLVIGIGSFASGKLRTASRLDEAASQLHDSLVQAAHFDQDHVLVLANEEAGRQSILDALGKGYLGSVSGPDDLVVVAVNTLCFPAADGEVYLLPYDTELDNFFATAIPARELIERIKTGVKARKVVLILQALFNGAPEMVSGCKTEFGKYNVELKNSQLPSNLVVMVSSRGNQPTWGSYFSDCLVKTLADDQGKSSVDEIFHKAHDRTVSSIITDCTGCKIQTPVLYAGSSSLGFKIGGEADRHDSPNLASVAKDADIRALSARVYTFFRHGKDELALGTITDACKAGKGELASDGRVNYLYGTALMRTGDLKGAADKFARAVAASPDNSIYRSSLALALAGAGKPSYDQWQTAHRLNPLNLTATLGLADEEIEKGAAEKAVRVLNAALKLYPDNADLHDRLSHALSSRGQLKEAIQHAHEAVLINDSSFAMFLHLGSLLLKNDRPNEAQAAFRQALTLSPETIDGYYLLASALEKTRDPDGALIALRKFIEESDPDDKRLQDARARVARLEKTPR